MSLDGRAEVGAQADAAALSELAEAGSAALSELAEAGSAVSGERAEAGAAASPSELSPSELSPSELAFAICELAADRKAHDIVELDTRTILGYTDYFVIATGATERQTRAIHDAIVFGIKHSHGRIPRRAEGLTQSSWILLDYLDVVVHLFTPTMRDYYRLEQLWGEAPARLHASEPAIAAGARGA